MYTAYAADVETGTYSVTDLRPKDLAKGLAVLDSTWQQTVDPGIGGC
jgi:hypothetical protein